MEFTDCISSCPQGIVPQPFSLLLNSRKNLFLWQKTPPNQPTQKTPQSKTPKPNLSYGMSEIVIFIMKSLFNFVINPKFGWPRILEAFLKDSMLLFKNLEGSFCKYTMPPQRTWMTIHSFPDCITVVFYLLIKTTQKLQGESQNCNIWCQVKCFTYLKHSQI